MFASDLENVSGETAADQKRRMEEKLAGRRQLKAEREAQGLSADEETLDDIQDMEEEEEKKKRKVRNKNSFSFIFLYRGRNF